MLTNSIPFHHKMQRKGQQEALNPLRSTICVFTVDLLLNRCTHALLTDSGNTIAPKQSSIALNTELC